MYNLNGFIIYERGLSMKKNPKLLLSLITFAMLITSCNGTSKKVEEDNSERVDNETMVEVLTNWSPRVTVTHDETLTGEELENSEMEVVPEAYQAKMSTSMLNAPMNTTLYMNFIDQGNESRREEYSALINANGVSNGGIAVTDADGINLDVEFQASDTYICFPFSGSFVYGEVYIVNLDPNKNLMFRGKDPSIQRITIEVEDAPETKDEYGNEIPVDNVVLKEDIPAFDLTKVSDELVDENANYSFIYEGAGPNLNEGDTFVVKKDIASENIDVTDFYGEFVSKEDLGNGLYKINYVEPDLGNVYTALEAKGEKDVDLSNIEILANTESIVSGLRYSVTARALVNLFAKYSQNRDPNNLKNLMDQIDVDLKFNYFNNKLTFTFSIGVSQIELKKDKFYLTFKYIYERVTTYTMDFDVSVKKKWKVIPVGVNYKIKCVEEVIESHTFLAVFDVQVRQKEKSEQEVQEDLNNEINAARGQQDNFYKRLKESAEACAQTEGNKTTLPLFKLDIQIAGPLTFELRFDFIFDITIQAMVVFKKQWKSNRVVFNFSNKGGGESDTHQEVKECNAWDIAFMGLAEVRVAFRLSGAIYIAGTYKYLHAEVYAEFYVKIGIQGALTASISPLAEEGKKFSGNYAIDMYILMGAKIGLELVVTIFNFDFSRDLFKTYLLRVYFSNEIEHFSDDRDKSFTMSKSVMSLDETNVLLFTVWDGVRMVLDQAKLKADSETKLVESWLGDISVRMFKYEDIVITTEEYKDEDWVSIDKAGNISIADGSAASFDFEFTVKVSNWAGFAGDVTIPVHFEAEDAINIYMRNSDDEPGTPEVKIGKFRPKATYTFVEPEEREGYRLIDFTIGDNSYHVGDVFTVPEGQTDDIHIVINWHKIIYYTVSYYDGLNNLIYQDSHVEEHTRAPEPDPAIRDQFMNGYFFIGWDKSLVDVSSDLVVRGIYVKVGD